jgi:tRNA threonylcarbamoyladenosine biosynthesis protein TsaB
LLLLETSQQPGFVAIAQGDRLLEIRRLDEARRHARDLAPTVAELLAKQNWQPRAIEAILVSRGPGSYTGLRVGVMSAKTFAYATRCALLSLETFAVIAAQSPPEIKHLTVLADAQQDKVYIQEFVEAAAVAPLRIETVKDWLQSTSRPLWVSGPGLRKWAAHLPDDVTPVDSNLWDPRPECLLRLGLARYQRGERDDFWSLEPIYLRPSAAEEQWRKKT